MLRRSAASGACSRSTKTAEAAPRDSASMPERARPRVEIEDVALGWRPEDVEDRLSDLRRRRPGLPAARGDEAPPPVEPACQTHWRLVPTSPLARGQSSSQRAAPAGFRKRAANVEGRRRKSLRRDPGPGLRASMRYTLTAYVAHRGLLRRRSDPRRVQHGPAVPPGPASARRDLVPPRRSGHGLDGEIPSVPDRSAGHRRADRRADARQVRERVRRALPALGRGRGAAARRSRRAAADRAPPRPRATCWPCCRRRRPTSRGRSPRCWASKRCCRRRSRSTAIASRGGSSGPACVGPGKIHWAESLGVAARARSRAELVLHGLVHRHAHARARRQPRRRQPGPAPAPRGEKTRLAGSGLVQTTD